MTTIAMRAVPSSRVPSNRVPSSRVRTAAPRLRLTARGRLVLGALAALPLLVVALLLGLGAPGASAGQETVPDSFVSVTVEPGQSLWQLAQSLAPGADPREVVAEIVALNRLSSASVQPGQDLAIPAAYTP